MTDGVDHINIYSKSATELGRALSNFSDHGVTTLDGEFASIEGYWYWLTCPHHECRDRLRYLVGWEAKAAGREMRGADWNGDPTFKLRIINAMVAKLILHDKILTPFRESVLPFRHYYVYGNKQIEPKEGAWIIETWECLRKVVKG